MRHGIRFPALIAALLAAFAAPVPAGGTLRFAIYNPGNGAMFPVSSVLVEGRTEAILIDAQFAASDARKLVDKIKASGRTLTTIYISHGDPDYYFGLNVVKTAFPDAKVFATARTVAHIKETQQAKLAYWGPLLKSDAPTKIIIPDVLPGRSMMLDHQPLQIMGLAGKTPDRTYVWMPSIKTIAGGVLVFGNLHVWTADTQSDASKQQWIRDLDRMAALKPFTVIPGHFKAGKPLGASSITFTRDYLKT